MAALALRASAWRHAAIRSASAVPEARLFHSLRSAAPVSAQRCGAVSSQVQGSHFSQPQVLRREMATGRADVDGGGDQISETAFHALGDTTLQRIYDALDAADLSSMDDIALDDGVLKIDLESGAAFVINKHYVTKQIWYASPVTGALYFSPQEDGSWKSVAKSGDLISVFLEDLAEVCPEAKGLDSASFRSK
mmetsp:Transcript_86861/g.156453  ORF Transcript_86861/g.156453 Transcript_86861/m.156453 type:complete len:193 (-) Transcript_86861:100-678(-)